MFEVAECDQREQSGEILAVIAVVPTPLACCPDAFAGRSRADAGWA